MSSRMAGLAYAPYDGDGDVAQLVDNSQNASGTRFPIERTGNPTTATTITYAPHSFRDIAESWSWDGTAYDPGYDTAGRKTAQSVGGTSQSVAYATEAERIVLQDAPAATLIDDVRFEWLNTGEVAGLYLTGAPNLLNDTSVDLTLTYGAHGNVTGATSSAGQYSYHYDHTMQRVKKTRALTLDGSNPRYFYSLDGRLLNERSPGDAFSSAVSTEYVWLNGEVVGVMYTHSTAQPTTVAYLVYTDRMGVPREYSTNAGARVQRLVTEPFGRGTLVDDNGTGVNPPMNLRYPGQYFDVESGLINNRWRTVIPQVGMFSSPEPLYAQTATRLRGPLTYSYAAGAPGRHTDASGQRPDGPPEGRDPAADEAARITFVAGAVLTAAGAEAATGAVSSAVSAAAWAAVRSLSSETAAAVAAALGRAALGGTGGTGAPGGWIPDDPEQACRYTAELVYASCMATRVASTGRRRSFRAQTRWMDGWDCANSCLG